MRTHAHAQALLSILYIACERVSITVYIHEISVFVIISMYYLHPILLLGPAFGKRCISEL